MNQNKINQLRGYIERLERLCDYRDLMLEEMQDVVEAAENSGFDRDALVAVVTARLSGETGGRFHDRTAIKYFHALGEVKDANKVAA